MTRLSDEQIAPYQALLRKLKAQHGWSDIDVCNEANFTGTRWVEEFCEGIRISPYFETQLVTWLDQQQEPTAGNY